MARPSLQVTQAAPDPVPAPAAPQLSVVIPARNAGATLHRAVRALQAQEAAPGTFEVVVVDDGSMDGSCDSLEGMAGPAPVRVVRQPPRGRAAARNYGAREARGRVLLFLDADILATPGLVRAHLAHHAGRPGLGVQGRLATDPASLATFFMRATHRVALDTTRRRREGLSPYHVVTRNFSVDAAAFHRAGGFDEAFRGYGWEDIELAYRLVRDGVVLRYEPAALAYHHHVQTLDDLCEKMRQAGDGAVYFWRKHGRAWRLGLFLEILPVLLPVKWLVYRSGLLTAPLLPVLRLAERLGLLAVAGEVYNHLLWRAYYEGVFGAWRRPAPVAGSGEGRGASMRPRPRHVTPQDVR
ncbi:MAG: glycosyltransferase family A protein [Armatimonadota bacterium]|nr:glycosyltransferase family A protein [Armatimonadota bacterium]